MRRAMRKPQYIPMTILAAKLTELNNYLPLFASSSASNKMALEELNEILIHAVTNRWEKQAHIQGWYF